MTKSFFFLFRNSVKANTMAVLFIIYKNYNSNFWKSRKFTIPLIIVFPKKLGFIIRLTLMNKECFFFLFSNSVKANTVTSEQDAEFRQDQSRIKQGWATLTALHSVLLPENVAKGGALYQPPLLEILARKWQNKYQEVRGYTGF